jgi:hypothetical protein
VYLCALFFCDWKCKVVSKTKGTPFYISSLFYFQKMIEKILCLFILLCALSSCYPGFKPFDFSNRNPIEWSSNRKVRWSDFKAKRKSIYGLEPYASPYFSIGFRNNRLNKTNVIAMLLADSSWVASVEVQNPLLLTHVQGHFDITEIHKRRIVKKIYEQHLQNATFEKESETIIKWLQEYYTEVEKYNTETNFGTLEDKQNEWTKNIEMRLSTE